MEIIKTENNLTMPIARWFAPATINKLIDKALSYTKDWKSWRSDIKDKLRRLSHNRSKIETLVYAAERGNIHSIDNLPLENWMGHLRDALEEADNVLDEMEIQPLREEMENRHLKGMKKKIVKFVKRAAKQNDLVKMLKQVVKIFYDLVSGLDTFAQVRASLAEHAEIRAEMSQETGSIFT
ncbi:Disease resistance protein RGA2 [Rhynchospora pubera]|uniref:Disease resistance protein RGA2 n=1 Tax=Rhynchospora pubera TaxID=906938 RepID=A0AAV8CWS7_9POAL|nr:Disease resistance protein RGA2 [Rhynchospora pubera]